MYKGEEIMAIFVPKAYLAIEITPSLSFHPYTMLPRIDIYFYQRQLEFLSTFVYLCLCFIEGC
jgi:hypothetical protein